MPNTKLHDFYPAIKDFEDTLAEAKKGYINDNQQKFVQQTEANYKKWGGAMFWTKKQDDWLNTIASGDYDPTQKVYA